MVFVYYLFDSSLNMLQIFVSYVRTGERLTAFKRVTELQRMRSVTKRIMQKVPPRSTVVGGEGN
jgi:hypothetical protein